MKKFINLSAALFAIFLTFISCNGNVSTPEAVTFNPDGGEITSGSRVVISTETENTTIYYSTKNRVFPTNYSTTGTAGKEGTSTVTVKISGEEGESVSLSAVAVDSNGNASSSKSVDFTIIASDTEIDDTLENTALYLGNPSNATADISNKENYLLERDQYSLSYNDTKHIPNWVAWHLDSDNLGTVSRSDDFHADSDLPSSFYAVTKSDYQYNTYGFDRGHMCPSGDRTDTLENNYQTFSMANMVPQSGNNNQKVWMHFENYIRSLAESGNEVYIYCGPLDQGGTSEKGSFDYISWAASNTSAPSDKGIVVPAYTWKVVIAIDKGSDDVNRISSTATCIAVLMPNTTDAVSRTGYSESNENSWKYYITTVDYIEEKTGYDFFANLPDDIENVLEAATYSE